MADSFYNEALDLLALNEIEESENKQNTVSINTLFDKAIKNAQIIENDFHETKYIDDAYFILGMSGFYQNKISASKYYFERIYNEFSENDFFYKSIIMLSKLNLKMDDIDKFNFYISMIDEKDLDREGMRDDDIESLKNGRKEEMENLFSLPSLSTGKRFSIDASSIKTPLILSMKILSIVI